MHKISAQGLAVLFLLGCPAATSTSSAQGDSKPSTKEPAQYSATSRVWSTADGRKVEATFLSVKDGIVSVRRKSDGKTFTVPLDRLSKDDQKWVADIANGEKLGTGQPRRYKILGGLIAKRGDMKVSCMLAWGGFPFSPFPLRTDGEMPEPKHVIRIESYDQERKQLVPTPDSAVPLTAPTPLPRTAPFRTNSKTVSVPLTHAVNVVWEFVKPGISFETDGVTYVSEKAGATIGFTKDGVEMKGIQKLENHENSDHKDVDSALAPSKHIPESFLGKWISLDNEDYYVLVSEDDIRWEHGDLEGPEIVPASMWRVLPDDRSVSFPVKSQECERIGDRIVRKTVIMRMTVNAGKLTISEDSTDTIRHEASAFASQQTGDAKHVFRRVETGTTTDTDAATAAAYTPLVLPEPKASPGVQTHWRTTMSEQKPNSGESINFSGLYLGMPSAGFSPEFALDLSTGTIKMVAQNVAIGAEHVFLGSVKWWGYEFESDPTFPLTFQVTQTGFQYLCGRGTVVSEDGKRLTFGKDDNLDAWIARCSDNRPIVRQGAIQAIGWLTKTDAERAKAMFVLEKFLDDNDWRIRRNAAEAIGRAVACNATQPLKKRLAQETDTRVTKVIQEVLANMPPEPR